MESLQEMKHYLGFGQDILFQLGAAIEQAGGNGYWDMRPLTRPEGKKILAQIGAIITDHRMIGSGDIKRVTVERCISVREAIERCHFRKVDPRIEKRFSFLESPDINREVVPIALLSHGHDVMMWGNEEQMVAEMKKKGYRPANLCELLALVAAGKFNLGATFALGSVDECRSDPKLACYVDAYHEQDGGHDVTVCLKVTKTDVVSLTETMNEIRDRRPDSHADKRWILAVRE